MAYTCVEVAKLASGTSDEVLQRASCELFPTLPKLPGFQGYVAGKISNDSLLSLGAWTAEEQAQSATPSLAGWAEQTAGASLASLDRRVGALSLTRWSDTPPAFVRLVFARLRPKVGEQLLDDFGEKMVSFYQGKPGFLCCGVMKADEESGMLFTGWESKAQAEARLLASASALKEVALSVASVSRLMFAFKSFDVYVAQVAWAEGALSNAA
jgi:hypothetical protein